MHGVGRAAFCVYFAATVATVPVVIDASDPPGNRAWSRLYAVLAVAALLCVLAGRILGPTDAWDQSQRITIAYTTDMLVNGRWVVPAERGGKPATKPPLYNWLAAPAVAAAGYSSELAHKLPSVVALVLCFVVVVVLGRRVIPGGTNNGAGWLAGVMFLANYTIFKIGYLARPDMLLVLWMFVGWAGQFELYLQRRLATVMRVRWSWVFFCIFVSMPTLVPTRTLQ